MVLGTVFDSGVVCVCCEVALFVFFLGEATGFQADLEDGVLGCAHGAFRGTPGPRKAGAALPGGVQPQVRRPGGPQGAVPKPGGFNLKSVLG